MSEPRVACRTPADGRDGVTNIPEWKFNVLRDAILKLLRDKQVFFKDLQDAVRPLLTDDQLNRLGSLGWHVTTVKLELEVRGEINRVPGSKPQMICLGGLEGN